MMLLNFEHVDKKILLGTLHLINYLMCFFQKHQQSMIFNYIFYVFFLLILKFFLRKKKKKKVLGLGMENENLAAGLECIIIKK